MALRNQYTGMSVTEEIRGEQLRKETRADLPDDSGSYTRSFLQITLMLKKQETEIAQLREQMTMLSERGTKEFAAEMAKHFDEYVERILTQRLKSGTLFIAGSSEAGPTSPMVETEKSTPEAQVQAGFRKKKRRERIRQLLLPLLAVAVLFLAAAVFLLACKLTIF